MSHTQSNVSLDWVHHTVHGRHLRRYRTVKRRLAATSAAERSTCTVLHLHHHAEFQSMPKRSTVGPRSQGRRDPQSQKGQQPLAHQTSKNGPRRPFWVDFPLGTFHRFVFFLIFRSAGIVWVIAAGDILCHQQAPYQKYNHAEKWHFHQRRRKGQAAIPRRQALRAECVVQTSSCVHQ